MLPFEVLAEVIAKDGDQWVVKSKSGKVLGRHPTKQKAIKQLVAVEISKEQRSRGEE